LQFEYRRPEIEQALMAARGVEALEAGLQAVIALTPQLGHPDVYGHKLFTPGLDAAVPTLARRLSLPDVAQAKSNDTVCIVSTQLYASGGHSKVAYDIAGLIGGERVSVIFTDIYGKLTHAGLIGARTAEAPMQRRADVLLGAVNLTGKIVELYNILAAIRPTRIFMLTHHFDMVAAVALWPFREVVEFLHHADHVPSIGATLPFSQHVDLTWRCHQVCLGQARPALYAGMTVRRPPPTTGGPVAGPSGRLRIATCGGQAKYRGAGDHRWLDYALAALSPPHSELVHIGPADDGFRAEITRELKTAGVDPQRYVFTGQAGDLAAELMSRQADIYLSSYPVTGGKANLEAMAIGLPVIVPIDPQSPQLMKFDFPAPTWIQVATPADLAARLEDIGRGGDGAGGDAARAALEAELARFETYVLGGPQAAPARSAVSQGPRHG